MQPAGHHLAELNLGILKYGWDDPRVQDFVNGLDLVNGAAKRSPGFVWMMDPEDMHFEQTHADGNMGANPHLASTLSVWESVAQLEHFVWNTVHKKFYDRKGEWYDMGASLRFAMWWVPIGHWPTMGEAMARFSHLDTEGASDYAFGWDYVKEAQLWKSKACG